MRVLITGGATQEPIDGVRYITNFSTGRTSRTMCDYFSKRGYEVIYLKGKSAVPPASSVKTIEFGSFDDLNGKIQKILGTEKFDLVIHAAAVGDYSVAELDVGGEKIKPDAVGKIDSQSQVTLALKPNFKIIQRLKEYAKSSHPILIGFKLTNTQSETERSQAIEDLFAKAPVDFVVHNDLGEIKGETTHPYRIFKNRKMMVQCRSTEELPALIENTIKECL